MALLVALIAAYGVFLVFTAVAFGWTGLGLGPDLGRNRLPARHRVDEWLAQAGLGDVRAGEFGAVVLILFVGGAALAFAIFGGVLAPLIAGGFAASFPIASYRARRDRRRADAREAWPRMIEEMRLLTGSLGRSVPQALFEVGRRGPSEMQDAFAAAQREWLISTDFIRTVAVLKHALADPTADATCETLLVAHEVGGSDLDRRLAALIEDRVQDLQGRKDARAKQSGVCFVKNMGSRPARPPDRSPRCRRRPALRDRGVLMAADQHGRRRRRLRDRSTPLPAAEAERSAPANAAMARRHQRATPWASEYTSAPELPRPVRPLGGTAFPRQSPRSGTPVLRARTLAGRRSTPWTVP